MHENTEDTNAKGPKEILNGKLKLRNHGIFETLIYYSIFIFYIVVYGYYQTYIYSKGIFCYKIFIIIT